MKIFGNTVLIFILINLFVFQGFAELPDYMKSQNNQNNQADLKALDNNNSLQIVIKGEQRPDGWYTPDRIIEIPVLSKGQYLENQIHVKVKNKYAINRANKVKSPSLQESFARIRMSKIENTINQDLYDKISAYDKNGLDRIYTVNFEAIDNVYDVCRIMMNNPEVEYAVPVFVHQPVEYVPSDPRHNTMWHMEVLEIEKAWDITKGDPDVLIAIIDSGTDTEHEDLVDNIWTNPNEVPDDGIDNDANGYIDDVHGWDYIGDITPTQLYNGISQPDNDPKPNKQFNMHGTHTAGCASAVTDNGIGVSSPAFQASILPIKCSADNNSQNQGGSPGIYGGYEAMVYAASLGADILNCSWGGPSYSPVEQEAIDLVTEMGAIVIAAAGNEGDNVDRDPHYPSGYEGVVAVGATRSNNRYAETFSNWGTGITLYAPGQSITSTVPNNGYNAQSGTSMACPVTSGVAALILSIHPDWTPMQIFHQLRSTVDDEINVSGFGRDQFYGQLNAFKAVSVNNPINSNNSIPGIRVSEIALQGTSALTDYEPKDVKFIITNYLSDANNLNVSIEPLNAYTYADDIQVQINELKSLDSYEIEATVTLLENNPWFKGYAEFLIIIQADGYEDYQLMKVPILIDSRNTLVSAQTFPDEYYITWHAASCPDENNFWMVGTSPYLGSVMYKHGVNPRIFSIDQSKEVYAVFAFDASKVYCAASPSNNMSEVKISENGGQSWQPVPTNHLTPFINDIYFYDQDNGIFLGDQMQGQWGVAITNNGGTEWTKITGMPLPDNDENGYVGSTNFHGDNIWFGTNLGRIYHSTNRGQLWTKSTVSQNKHIHKIAFASDTDGIAIYANSTSMADEMILANTTDGGATWNTDVYNFAEQGLLPIYAYSPDGSSQIFVLSYNGEVYKTADLGQTWEPVLSEQVGNATLGCGLYYGQNIRMWQGGSKAAYLDFEFIPENAFIDLKVLAETDIDFGSVDVNTTLSKEVPFRNDGNINSYVDDIEIIPEEGVDSKEFRIGLIRPRIVSPGEVENLSIIFKPQEEGTRAAVCRIYHDGNDTPIELYLTGQGIPVSSVNEDESDKINISPNPAKDKLNVEIGFLPNNSSISIINTYGQVVANHEFSGQNVSLPLDNLANGQYYLEIYDGNKRILQKFIIAR